MIDLWYKNAVVYCLDVETFMDADGDGVGDFRGLADRLDHLEGLGVTTVWLNPFYPTPNRDNGYDVTDFYGIDPRLGSAGDFVVFLRAARDRGMRVLVDLVANHTSIDHPWFRSARASTDSPYRDWYVWSEEEPEDLTEGIIFPGVQEAVWTWDETAQAWYLHRFYAHQADLNIANPAVREEILRIMGYWLELGVSGFRVDAVPFLVEYKGLKEEPDREPLLLLSEMRDFLSWRRAEAILLAEANVERDRAPLYFGGRAFGEDERMQLLFDFPLNQALWLAFVRHDPAPVVAALRSRPEEDGLQAQWAVFLRNHDELSLDKLGEAEREEVFAACAPDEGMRLYDRGIRRRLAPMLGGDARRVALAQSLLFALPGTPVMWYGDEIGMGEDLDLPERDPVRTPMQWSDEPHGGFSDAAETVRPAVAEGPLGYHETNVTAQEGRPASLLGQVQALVRARRACPAIGWGSWRVIEGLPEGVLGLACAWRGSEVVTLHNFTDRDVQVPLSELGTEPLAQIVGPPDTEPGPVDGHLALRPYDYRWLRAGRTRK
ncbi:putative trehalose synthase protein [Oceanicola granulosus HTCC2516]|uniref:Putative trehalose synthase protein n=1 Tax=Oceanicola granulosus (strain ATCC BAA-861 / DSM 15982 / KCTC 12143 / HTCC2516) TaxID=314256 RepID=Q2CAT9_OCEGH|nr:alpha-amylase family protein [Oceanicola granulosus]EAR49792.1 putative trehalose synthase protein [Oceanicola granulosus HTCC2516]